MRKRTKVILRVLGLIVCLPVIYYFGSMAYFTVVDAIPKPSIKVPSPKASYEQNYNAISVSIESKYPFLAADRYGGWDNSYMIGVRMRKGTISPSVAQKITDDILPKFRAIGGGSVMFWDTTKGGGSTIAQSPKN